MSGRKTADGQLIVGISEHVSYWNGLGWRDPFSSELFTGRQSNYSNHFGLDSVYTPQMVVNGREQFVGSDRRSLEAALATESQRKQIELHINSTQVTEKSITFSYSASDLPPTSSLQLIAVLVDDTIAVGDYIDVGNGHYGTVEANLIDHGKLFPTRIGISIGYRDFQSKDVWPSTLCEEQGELE